MGNPSHHGTAPGKQYISLRDAVRRRSINRAGELAAVMTGNAQCPAPAPLTSQPSARVGVLPLKIEAAAQRA